MKGLMGRSFETISLNETLSAEKQNACWPYIYSLASMVRLTVNPLKAGY